MRHLSEPDIVYIHDRTIEATSGDYGIRDKKLLASICERPKTAFYEKEQYPSVWQKAAVYAESFAKHHVFVDGNKRVAIAAAARFLYMNGYVLNANNQQLEELAVSLVEHNLTVEDIAVWLKCNSYRCQDNA
jgi:death-on-curing protein